MAHRRLFLHPPPSCLPGPPLCHFLRLFSLHSPILHRVITGKLTETQSAKRTPSTVQPCSSRTPSSRGGRPHFTARLSFHVLPSPLFSHSLSLQLCQEVSLAASHLLTHSALYIFSVCTQRHTRTSRLPLPASTSCLITPIRPTPAAPYM